MPDILVIDPSSICRELLISILEAQGYSAAPADLAQAEKAIRSLEPKLVIIEPGPPGTRGWVLLAELRRALLGGQSTQIVIITDQAGKAQVLRAAQMGVRDYMLKCRFSVPELLTRIRRHLPPPKPPASVGKDASTPAGTPPAQAPAAGGNTPAPSPRTTINEDRSAILAAAIEMKLALLTREKTLEKLEKAPVKTLPGVVAELISLVNSPRGTISDVSDILRRDPVLAARTLRVANSAGFATQRARISTVEDAVKIIGVGGVRNLVINVGVFDAFATGATGNLGMARVWQHCLGVAMLMEKLTPEDVSAPPGSAYLVGLCHDLADLVLRQLFVDQYRDADLLSAQCGCRQRIALNALLGMPYSELVSHLLGQLRLPAIITVPIEEFFEHGERMGPRGSGSVLGRTLRAINVYAHGLMLAPSAHEPITPLTKAECTRTFGTGPLATLDDEQLRGEALTTASVLAGLSSEQTQQMVEPLVPRQNLTVCYCRDEEFGKFDPLAAFLQLSSKDLITAPPLASLKPDTMNDAGAVVIASRNSTHEAIDRDLQHIRQLTLARPIPVLYLAKMNENPAGAAIDRVTVRRLPIDIQTLGDFLIAAASPNLKKAA